MRATKNASSVALVGIWTILLTAFVVTILYVGRQLLIPLALAAMLTFLLAPLVGSIERWIGRIAAVLIVVAMLFSVASGAGWLGECDRWSGAGNKSHHGGARSQRAGV
jgi:predicted PurR-regulated permease PerM